MQDYRIGRLNGRHVVIWNDDAGVRHRYRLAAHTAQEAEREARNLILALQAPPAGVTVAQIWGAYQDAMQGRRQAAKLAQVGRNVLPAFGHLSAETLTADDCRTYLERRRADKRQPGTIRTELGCLRSACLWAQKNRLIARAPAITMPPGSPPRDRYLTRAEAERLLAAAREPHIRLVMLLMLTTAGRIGALLELTWQQVDLDRGVIRLAKQDIGPRKGRATVPINDTLHAALTEAKRAALSPYVIEWGGRRVTTIKTGFNAARERSGIDHCTPHDLRRTAGRLMAEAGVPIEQIAQYLGHTNPNITRSTYAQFSPQYLRDAASALEIGGDSVQRTRKKTPA